VLGREPRYKTIEIIGFYRRYHAVWARVGCLRPLIGSRFLSVREHVACDGLGWVAACTKSRQWSLVSITCRPHYWRRGENGEGGAG